MGKNVYRIFLKKMYTEFFEKNVHRIYGEKNVIQNFWEKGYARTSFSGNLQRNL